MNRAFTLPLGKLKEEPYASLLCYPRVSNVELRNRLKELQRLGVKALEFYGNKQVCQVSVLGKGCVGIVVVAYVDGEKAALKIRRVDADRSGLQHEAEMLAKANSVQVGPKLLDASKNFLLMQFIDGDLLPDWLERHGEKGLIRKVLSDVLEQCWRLDEIGLDHGELSHAPKHIIVGKDGKPSIVDFETASVNRRPSNVTSICQFLLVSGAVAEVVAEKVGRRGAETIVEGLRLYKNNRTRENFEKILHCLLYS
jgi:putative serine/threonine protein kinase